MRSVIVEDFLRGWVIVRRSIWRVTHDCSPNAMPLFIVGIQRSGTNMLTGAFAKAPEAEIHNERRSSAAFCDWMLRDDSVVRSLIESSRHRCIIFKSLGDAARLVHLMEGLGTPSPGRSIWIYRDVADRVRSVYAWSERAGETGRKIAAGYRSDATTGGLSEERLAVASGLDPAKMSRATGAALFWYLRNSLFFDLGFDRRPDVALISYDRFVVEPERFMTQLCDFAGIPFRKEMISRIARRPPPTPLEPDIDPEINSRCGDLQRRLDDEFDRRLRAGALVGRMISPAGI